jgi:hypothetical protein
MNRLPMMLERNTHRQIGNFCSDIITRICGSITDSTEMGDRAFFALASAMQRSAGARRQTNPKKGESAGRKKKTIRAFSLFCRT